RMGDAAEGADQVDLQNAIEILGGKLFDLAAFPVARCGTDGVARSGAIDQDTSLAVGGARFFETFLHAVFASHIDLTEDAADFGGDFPSPFFLQIEQRDLYPVF